MSHRAIRERLADFALDRLETPERVEVERHLPGCRDCRDWLETYELLGAGLRAPAALEHPDAADLAGWAVRGAALPEDATAHLAACPACAGELDDVRAALAAARDGLDEEVRPRRPPAKPTAIRWAAAAALVLAVVAGSILLLPGDEPEPPYRVSGGTLPGDSTIAARAIHVSDVVIPSGSNIVFAAGETVALGDGFVVASGASFTAKAAAPPADRTEPPADRRQPTQRKP